LKALVTLEDHLWRGADGYIYGHGPTGYSVWSELLESFEEVVLLARVGHRNDLHLRGNKVEGPAHFSPGIAGLSRPLELLAGSSRLCDLGFERPWPSVMHIYFAYRV
jgi:hypothetical protein